MTHQWDVTTYCALIKKEIAVFVEAVAGADLSLPAPTCPGWSVGDVVLRSGEMFQWIEAIVHNDSEIQPDFRRVRLSWPDRTADYVDWLADCGHSLVDELRVHDPAKPMWSWGEEQSLRFWARRAQHDTSIHRADVELALGRVPAFDGEVAADGIDEFLDVLSHAGRYSARIAGIGGRGEKIRLAAPESDWTIELTPQGYAWRRGHEGESDVTASGEVADLLLLIWGRNKPSSPRIRVAGKKELLDYWAGSAIMG
jgi:uncharacterized protein (TIGR03083 family)